MKKSVLTAAGLFLANALFSAHAAIVMSVTNEVREESSGADFLVQFLPLANYLRDATGTDVRMVFSQNLTQELQRTRTGHYGLLLGPAHVIGSALRHGYEPIASFPGEEKMVFLVKAASPIKTIDDIKGAKIALPAADSLATYLALGEFNARGWAVKTHFQEVRHHRFHEVVLWTLELDQADVATVEKRIAQKWLEKNQGRVLFETRPVPALGIAVSASLDKALQARIREALLSPNTKRASYTQVAALNIAELKPMTKDSYAYVSTLGYFTPTVLSGIKVVTAEEVQELMRRGATFYDVRVEREYREKHCKGATSLPYVEKSKKEVAFDMSQDEFKLAEAAKDKNAPLIFACNGGECWKSYKASVWAQKQGYKNVHWFRGGFPECKEKGLPLE